MRAIVIDRFGGPEELRLDEVPTPIPAEGQVLVRVAYAGINPADWKDREGLVAGFYEASFPHILGFDAAGTVAQVGHGVIDFAPGNRVFTTSDHGEGVDGSYAEYLLVSAPRLAKLPPQVDLAAAAATPVAALTAWQALVSPERGDLQRGQRVLIHGGSGGVGSFAVQFAAHRGAHVAATCSAANLDYVRELGADCALDYGEAGYPGKLRAWAPGGLDLIVDAVGGDTLPGKLELLRRGGRLVSIATLVADGDIAAETAEAKALGVRKIFAIMDSREAGRELEEIGQLLAAGAVRPPPIEVYPMADVRAAHERIQSGHVRGKLVLEIAGD